MTASVAPPVVRFKGRVWSSAALAHEASIWRAHLTRALGPSAALVAIPLASRPSSIAAFFALSAGPRPVMILSEDPRSWDTAPAIPVGTVLILAPEQRHLAASAMERGLRPELLPAGDETVERTPPADGAAGFFTAPGFVFTTSGTTGRPKPVVTTARSLLESARVTASMQRIPRGAGIIGALPLNVKYGFLSTLALATVVEGALGLLERFDHRAVLALFATREYAYFSCTPVMADLLGRCPIDGPPPPAPAAVMSSAGPLPPAVFRAFKARFGVAPRATYGSTEGHLICGAGPDDPERPESVGRAAPGIEVRIGDDPRQPLPSGAVGPIWYASPWYMEGYGFPGALEPRDEIDGWFPTSDLGVIDADGMLTLLGRRDDCFKTAAGHLINPAEVAAALRAHPTVLDAAVVPLPGPAGATIAALVEADEAFDMESLRNDAARRLPASSLPATIVAIATLPRLPTGKVDRPACVAALRPS